jgi:hypothetical protein
LLPYDGRQEQTVRNYTLHDHTEVDYPGDDRMHIVTRSGRDAWCVSYAYTDPADVTLHVYRFTGWAQDAERTWYPVGPAEHHELDGTRWPSLDAARRAAWDAGVLVWMRYEDEVPS